MTPKEALDRLMQGNERYVADKSLHPNRSLERREELASNQSPYAIIVGCSDSRAPPAIIFDEGLGDLFIVRVAGNVIGPIELESIEYSAFHLKSVLILILGHKNCGAVLAVVDNETKDIKTIAKLIEPAVKEAKKSHDDHTLLEAAIKLNALRMKELVQKDPKIGQLIGKGKIEVQAAYYNITTGTVEILEN